jgi:hypothetical protein
LLFSAPERAPSEDDLDRARRSLDRIDLDESRIQDMLNTLFDSLEASMTRTASA